MIVSYESNEVALSKSQDLRIMAREALNLFLDEGYNIEDAVEKLTGQPVPKFLQPITIVEAEALLVLEAKRQYNGISL